jgi:DNA polymerase III gamma/tau subunit
MVNDLEVTKRPKNFSEVVGQGHVTSALQKLYDSDKLPHKILLHGSTGIGKTTIGRILGGMIKCSSGNIIEMDAASNNGVDYMKKLNSTLMYSSLGKHPNKLIIIDECFHSSTIINGLNEDKSIKDVMIGDKVLNLTGIGTVTYVHLYRVSLNRVVRVDLDTKKPLFCSRDHIFFSSDGEIEAINLNPNLTLYGVHSRYRKQETKDSNRSRRKETQSDLSEIIRQEEREQVERVRVESVEIYQRGHNDESFLGIIGDKERDQGYVEFYDLEIDSHPSYYANNVLVHNCQRLSIQSWEALLKTLEEPPDHVYFVLCTTEFSKVPDTIRGRCKKFKLKEVDYEEILKLITKVATEEEIELNESSLKLIARNANGCPREALSSLDQCRMCESKEEVSKILSSYVSGKDVKDLCRIISSGRNFNYKDVQNVLTSLKNKNPESVRILVSNYLMKCILSATGKDQMMYFGGKLNHWSKVVESSQGFSEIALNTLLSIWGD